MLRIFDQGTCNYCSRMQVTMSVERMTYLVFKTKVDQIDRKLLFLGGKPPGSESQHCPFSCISTKKQVY